MCACVVYVCLSHCLSHCLYPSLTLPVSLSVSLLCGGKVFAWQWLLWWFMKTLASPPPTMEVRFKTPFGPSASKAHVVGSSVTFDTRPKKKTTQNNKSQRCTNAFVSAGACFQSKTRCATFLCDSSVCVYVYACMYVRVCVCVRLSLSLSHTHTHARTHTHTLPPPLSL